MATNMIKRLIVCCDGTFANFDSDDGFKKPTLIPYKPTAALQVPSNVTRISRALRRVGLDGIPQIIFYHSGVGTSSTKVDIITGGLLGIGISENIREVYSFLAANYTPGDEIVLIGFSRGAFTVRSVASMITNIGLLTREGMEDFYPIFKDYQNFKNERYHDIFPEIPFPNKPTGPDAAYAYKQRLEKDGFTRVYDPNGSKIKTHAVAVFDTVGSLGIPNISLLAKLGLPHSTIEYKFFDTNLSGNIRHAFQALALDERRAPFKAAVWERANRHQTTVDLRQVWFPGAHSNVGGGYDDQEIANITLAWLASIGIAFQDDYIDKVFIQNVRYYENPPKQQAKLTSLISHKPQWAIDYVYEKHKPVRPWGLGKIWDSKSSIWILGGTDWRTPGLNMRADPETGLLTNVPMKDTNERIHSCVRIRLELDGLGLDDKGLYQPQALEKNWRPRRVPIRVQDPIAYNASWGPGAPAPDEPAQEELRWVWEYIGPEHEAPAERYMLEETLGPYERKLLLLNKGKAIEDLSSKARLKHGRKFYKRFRRRKRRSRRGNDSYDHGQFTIEDDLGEDKATKRSHGVRSSTTGQSDVRSSQYRSERRSRRERPADSDERLVGDRPPIPRPRERVRSRSRSRLRVDEKVRPVSESEESLVDEREVRRSLRERERAIGFDFDSREREAGSPPYRDEPEVVVDRRSSRAQSPTGSRTGSRVGGGEKDYEEIIVLEDVSDIGRRRRSRARDRSRVPEGGAWRGSSDGRRY
ncbi:hypothetical protein BUE80_DR000332 [Diplocarpon rosae]|nr:hypothetical protein BUE80_DR000332 [Diplocarpon rosae]